MPRRFSTVASSKSQHGDRDGDCRRRHPPGGGHEDTVSALGLGLRYCFLIPVDPGGVGSEANYDYNWQDDVEREFDTSGRGVARTFEGRGLVASETPDTNLTTAFTYDSLGSRRVSSLATGAQIENVYDDFGRVQQAKRIAGPNGGHLITTTYTYDAANNVTRIVVDEAAVGTLSDSTALFDEGNFNYESRQRLTAGADGASDPVVQRKFDWAGNITEQRSLGDSTVADRVITTHYDGADRVDWITDSEGGRTDFARDDRGNVTEQTVKLNASENAVTTTVYDALSRAMQITGPEDSAAGRPDRVRSYDSRGNLLREMLRDAADVPKMTTVFGYDNAGRQTRRAVLANAAAPTDAAGASVTTDRATDFQYDADARLTLRRTYNNNSSTPRDTTTTYDPLGRVDVVTDPSGSFADDNYATNGRLNGRVVNDGAGSRTFTYAYDGHDRPLSQTALGVLPDHELTTASTAKRPLPTRVALAYTPTAINQVGAMALNGSPVVNYTYVNNGRVLEKRRITTSAAGGDTYYDYQPGCDSHRRVGSIINTFIAGGGPPQTIAAYTYTRDNDGNPLTQTAGGQAPFADDDRAFTVDRLNRLTAAQYTTLGGTETAVLDLVSNRETHTPRTGPPTARRCWPPTPTTAWAGGSVHRFWQPRRPRRWSPDTTTTAAASSRSATAPTFACAIR